VKTSFRSPAAFLAVAEAPATIFIPIAKRWPADLETRDHLSKVGLPVAHGVAARIR